MIDKNYHKVVFDRFKRYDEPQKELNPINWLDVGFVVPYLSEHTANQKSTNTWQHF